MIPDRIAPIPFDMPPPDHGCAGSLRLSKPQLFGVCHLCARLGNDGPQVAPAARMTGGTPYCPNFVAIDGVHETHLAPHQPTVVCLTVGGQSGGKKAPSDGFRNAGVTARGVAK